MSSLLAVIAMCAVWAAVMVFVGLLVIDRKSDEHELTDNAPYKVEPGGDTWK